MLQCRCSAVAFGAGAVVIVRLDARLRRDVCCGDMCCLQGVSNGNVFPVFLATDCDDGRDGGSVSDGLQSACSYVD